MRYSSSCDDMGDVFVHYLRRKRQKSTSSKHLFLSLARYDYDMLIFIMAF